MSDSQFKKGEIVILKSGGPEMTIESIDEDNKFVCVWIDKNQAYRFAFEATVLMYPSESPLGFLGSV